MQGHFHLTGNRFAHLAPVTDQHRKRDLIELDQRRKGINHNAQRGVLHDDGRTLAPHEGAGAKPHAFVFLIRGNMQDFIGLFQNLDHPCQLFAGHRGYEVHTIAQKIIDDLPVCRCCHPYAPKNSPGQCVGGRPGNQQDYAGGGFSWCDVRHTAMRRAAQVTVEFFARPSYRGWKKTRAIFISCHLLLMKSIHLMPFPIRKHLKTAAAALTVGLLATSPSQGAEGLRFSDISFGLGPARAFYGQDKNIIFGDTGETRLPKAVRVFKQSVGGVGADLTSIFTFPFREPGTTVAFAAGIGALMMVDRQTTIFWQDRLEPAFDSWSLPRLFNFGPSWLSGEGQYVLAAIGGTYALGLAFNDERAQVAALLASKAVAYSYLTSQVVLKPLFGRLRPVDNLSTFTGDPGDFTTDPFQFGNRRGIPFGSVTYGTAMPSFHFTMFFSVARIYSEVYDNYLIPYAAAGLISAANIRGHNHWVSDMVAGAVIGTVIGNVILNEYADRRQGPAVMVAPYVQQGQVGITFSAKF